MQVVYHLNRALPRLAWLARADTATGRLVVEHGANVETRDRLFFEGAWAGAFDEGRPDLTEVVFGTGAVVEDDAVLFVPSVATTDYLYYRTDGPTVTVANSLALLLAALDDSLVPENRDYVAINRSIMRGIREYQRDIPTRHGGVRRVMYYNLRVDARGAAEVAKPEPPPFPNFDAYANYLSASYAALVANARDTARTTPLHIYTTQSKGYDSTAINGIAAPHGVDAVFTITRGKPGRTFSDDREIDDDGTEIANILGIGPVIPMHRRGFQEDSPDELYFYAGIHECQDANLKQVADHITEPGLLLTGTLGEAWYTHASWYKDRPGIGDAELRRVDFSTHGLTEVRLRVGYIQVAVPYIGARRRAEVLRITESPEMDPWRLGVQYDRPIPRRLGEAAGVPREAFGQHKAGSVVAFTPPQFPRGRSLRKRYEAFLVKHRLRRAWQLALTPLVHRANEMIALASETQYPAVHYAYRAASKLARRDVPRTMLWSDLRAALFCFAVNECVTEYAAALRRDG